MINNTYADRAKYDADVANGVVAYRENGTTVPLNKISFNKVRFIGGLWRVQRCFKEPITTIRDKEFVICSRLPKQEKNHFEYYTAKLLIENCYGKYIMGGMPNYIVAKYETQDGTFWSYGETIEQARAFLGIKLYDTYSDLIHRAVGLQKTK